MTPPPNTPAPAAVSAERAIRAMDDFIKYDSACCGRWSNHLQDDLMEYLWTMVSFVKDHRAALLAMAAPKRTLDAAQVMTEAHNAIGAIEQCPATVNWEASARILARWVKELERERDAAPTATGKNPNGMQSIRASADRVLGLWNHATWLSQTDDDPEYPAASAAYKDAAVQHCGEIAYALVCLLGSTTESEKQS